MALRTQGCTLGYRIWPPWGFHLALGNGGPTVSFPRYPKYKPSGVGRVGYEIPFNRHFYVFQPPRTLSAIDADLKATTDRILTMIGGLTQ